MSKKTVVIFKHDPKAMSNDNIAMCFYHNIRNYIRKHHDVTVIMDKLDPNIDSDESADLWIAHSKQGAEWLDRSVSDKTLIALGVPLNTKFKKDVIIINHHKDVTFEYNTNVNFHHYFFTEDMKVGIDAALS